MAKLKDGFYKQTAEAIGSDLHVLLAGGGSKALTDFAYKSDLTGFVTGGPYLPTAGGTITGTLKIYRDAAAINYCSSGGTSHGWLGFSEADVPRVWLSNGSTSYPLLHTGNYSGYLDGRYYTETEVNNLLSNYLPINGTAAAASKLTSTKVFDFGASAATYCKVASINITERYGGGSGLLKFYTNRTTSTETYFADSFEVFVHAYQQEALGQKPVLQFKSNNTGDAYDIIGILNYSSSGSTFDIYAYGKGRSYHGLYVTLVHGDITIAPGSYVSSLPAGTQVTPLPMGNTKLLNGFADSAFWKKTELTKLSQLTDDIVTGNYLPLAGGNMKNAAVITFTANGTLRQTTATTSNATSIVEWYKGTSKDPNYTHPAQIGWHNTGNTDGAIYLVPHPTDTDPWVGSVGLYIGKTALKWNNQGIIHSGNIGSQSVNYASNAGVATTAGYANQAGSADTAGYANQAGSADYADIAGGCSYGTFGNAATKSYTSTVSSTSDALITSSGVDAAIAKYLPLTGGTLYNSSNRNPLSINSASGESGIKFQIAYANKGWFGYDASYGVGIYNYTRGKYLNYKDDGTLQFEGNEVLHSGNWSNYITLPTTPSGGYIGTTAVQASSTAGQNITGIGDITPNTTKVSYLGNSSLYWKEVTANIFRSYGGSSTWAAFYQNSSGNTVFENSSGAFYINSKSLASLKAASNQVILGSGTAAFYPNTTLTLGTSSQRWSYVYATHLNAEGGSFYTDANGAYWTSDARLKTNIVKARNLDIADLLVEFDWKDSGNHSWGYIAQELLEVLPEAVSYNSDTDRYAVNYNVAHSAAIASLTARIKELEEKLKKYGIQ